MSVKSEGKEGSARRIIQFKGHLIPGTRRQERIVDQGEDESVEKDWWKILRYQVYDFSKCKIYITVYG